MKALLIAIMLLGSAYAYGEEPLKIRGPIVQPIAEAPSAVDADVTPPLPRPPTISEFALCTAETLPGTIGKCARLTSAPKMDDRSFYTALFGTIGGTITVLGSMVMVYIDPPPLK